MAPSYVSRDQDINEELAERLIQRVEKGPAKPWTIISDVSSITDANPEVVREKFTKLLFLP